MTRSLRIGRCPWLTLGASAAAATFFGGACGWRSLGAVALSSGSPDAGSTAAGPSDAELEPEDEVVEPGADAAPSTQPCTPIGTPIDAWTFDAGIEGWSLSLDPNVQASLTWTGGAGNPTPGALQVTIAPSEDAGTITGGWVEYSASLGDLSSRTASAWVWLEKGTAPHLKLFVQTGSHYAWADNGTIYLSPQIWTCLSLNLQSPSYEQATYDPTDVITIGFEMLGSAPFQLYIGTVQIY